MPAYVSAAPGVMVRSERLPMVLPDTVLFDVDGVLVDVHGSFPVAISQAVQHYFTAVLAWPGTARLIEPHEIAWFKLAGGFNNDWTLARGIVFHYLARAERLGARDVDTLRSSPPSLAEVASALRQEGGGMPALERISLAGLTPSQQENVRRLFAGDLINRICCEYYAGGEKCQRIFGFSPEHYFGPGLIDTEEALLYGEDLPSGPRYGLYTGRTTGEVREALALCHLEGRLDPRAVVDGSSGYRKPDPRALQTVAEAVGTRLGLFAGDNIDDFVAVDRYRRELAGPPFLFAAILGGAPGPRGREAFAELGADLICASTRELVSYLSSLPAA